GIERSVRQAKAARQPAGGRLAPLRRAMDRGIGAQPGDGPVQGLRDKVGHLAGWIAQGKADWLLARLHIAQQRRQAGERRGGMAARRSVKARSGLKTGGTLVFEPEKAKRKGRPVGRPFYSTGSLPVRSGQPKADEMVRGTISSDERPRSGQRLGQGKK